MANRSRIGVKVPEYVAGFDRGVRPMGDWSMLITLSTNSSPETDACAPGRSREPKILWARTRYRVSRTSVDFPEPDTPVTQVIIPRGTETSMDFRLFAEHPDRARNLPLGRRRDTGTGIARRPDMYWPVRDASFLRIPSGGA